MDRGQFDALAWLVAATTSRRLALGALLGAALLRQEPDPAQAKRKGKGKGKGKRKKTRCYPGKGCVPGPGRNNAGCDFSGSTLFENRDVQGSQLRGASFSGADLRGANLLGVDLGGACLTGADLSGASLDGSTKLKDAILCQTILPDGAIENGGCDKGTRCCPAEPPEEREEEPEEQCEICPQRYCCHCEDGPQAGICRLIDFDPNNPINIGFLCGQICVTGTPRFLFIDSDNANFCDTSNECVQIACPVM